MSTGGGDDQHNQDTPSILPKHTSGTHKLCAPHPCPQLKAQVQLQPGESAQEHSMPQATIPYVEHAMGR